MGVNHLFLSKNDIEHSMINQWIDSQSPEDKQFQASLIEAGALPRHIAIIMDGNGRWAMDRNLPRAAGHQQGIESVRDIV